MKKYWFVTFWVFLSFLFSNSTVSADLMNPDYYDRVCKAGEVEVVCRYQSKEPFGPLTYDGCKEYSNDSSYYYLVGEGSSFGGSSKYCKKAFMASESSNLQNILVGPFGQVFSRAMIINLVIEILAALFFVLTVKNMKRLLMVVFIVNLFTLSVVWIVLPYLVGDSFVHMIVSEIFAVIFEGYSIYYCMKDVSMKKSFLLSLWINSCSFFVGGFILNLINLLFPVVGL